MSMNKITKRLAIFALLLIVLAASACSAPKPAGLTDLQVTSVTENMLKAIEAKDYPAFTWDFSDQMNSAFTQAQFDSLGALLKKNCGSYVSLGAPGFSNNQGYAVYRIPATYTNETVYVTVTFLVGGQKVEGLFFDSANLRKAGK
jgi:hypothetical protein